MVKMGEVTSQDSRKAAATTDISEAERLALLREFRPPPSGLPLFL
jgi:hypothetical protein